MGLPLPQPYVDMPTAQAYFDATSLNSGPWDAAPATDRLKALVQATMRINNLQFKGRKPRFQLNEWPRIGIGLHSTHVPLEIQYACCEIALMLLDGWDENIEEDGLGDISQAYATIRRTSDTSVRRDHIKAGIPSVTAWKMLLPFLVDPYAVVIRREYDRNYDVN